jgi:hypothetical protein
MTERLKQVVARVEQLPADQQDELAELLQLELEQREWDALIATPESRRYLAQLVAEAEEEDAAGKTLESGDRW